MTTALNWPALGIEQQPLPRSIDCERGVWGKVHGAPTDYRWIARSDAFGAGRQDLPLQLNLGTEDIRAHFQAWRNLGDRCFAVSIYPSRAVDAAGRRNFLEKQVLAWRRPPHVPAAFGALLLLSAAAKLSDDVWWGRDVPPDSEIPIDPQSLSIDEHALADVIERGRQTLRDMVTARMLELLYDQLLARRRPSFLYGLLQPLTPAALAALLLPLPREIADRVSIAGWIPTSRPLFDVLGTRWDIIIASPEQTAPRVPPPPTEQAMEMADELLATEPAPFRQFVDRLQPGHAPAPTTVTVDSRTSSDRIWPGMVLNLRPPSTEAGEVVTKLWKFARAPNRRWLDPRTLQRRKVPKFAAHTEEARLLCEWVIQVGNQKPEYEYADKEQWNVKIDLLRSAALVLVPEPSTWRNIGPQRADDRVPILFFALMMESPNQWDRLIGLGERVLTEAVHQSLRCRSRHLVDEVRKALLRWKATTPHLAGLIERALIAGR